MDILPEAVIFRPKMIMKVAPETNDTPAALKFSMPAEWEEHEATWLGWPHNPTDWPDKLDTIRWVYGEMVRKISAGEIVRILVRNLAEKRLARRYLRRAGCELHNVQFLVHPTNRGWMRDSGPIFVKRKKPQTRGQDTETAIVHFHFNAWAKYRDWQMDRRVPAFAGRVLRRGVFHAERDRKPFVMQHGALELNRRR